jgi:hypothetical protein
VSDKCTCCTCGYQWVRGLDGSHSCTSHMSKELDQLRAENAQLKTDSAATWTKCEDLRIENTALAMQVKSLREALEVCVSCRPMGHETMTEVIEYKIRGALALPDSHTEIIARHDAEVLEKAYHAVRGSHLQLGGVALTATQVSEIYNQLSMPIRRMAQELRGKV